LATVLIASHALSKSACGLFHPSLAFAREFIGDMTLAPPDVRDFVALTFRGLLKHPDFTNVLPGIVSQSTRTGLVLQGITSLCAF
jgi:hypothetical protein